MKTKRHLGHYYFKGICLIVFLALTTSCQTETKTDSSCVELENAEEKLMKNLKTYETVWN